MQVLLRAKRIGTSRVSRGMCVLKRAAACVWGFLQTMLDVHVTAPFKVIQALTPLIREAAKKEQDADGAAAPRSIINISSVSGTHGNAGEARGQACCTCVAGMLLWQCPYVMSWGCEATFCNGFLQLPLLDHQLAIPAQQQLAA